MNNKDFLSDDEKFEWLKGRIVELERTVIVFGGMTLLFATITLFKLIGNR